MLRLADRGEQRSAQLLRRYHLELRQWAGAEAVFDREPRVLELLEAEGCHVERGHARAEAGGARAGAAMMDDHCHFRKEPLVRDTTGDEHILGRPRRQLGRVGLGSVELVEVEPEELAATRAFEGYLKGGLGLGELRIGVRIRGEH